VPIRDRTEIVAGILETAKDGGVNKTKIMYRAGISHGQLKEYLTSLELNGLLSYNGILKIYRTTDKGFAFLQIYAQLNELLRETKLEVTERML
jgi:predicted transcriptional regulator